MPLTSEAHMSLDKSPDLSKSQFCQLQREHKNMRLQLLWCGNLGPSSGWYALGACVLFISVCRVPNTVPGTQQWA